MIEEEKEQKWKVQIKGEKYSTSWEISVVREDNEHGQRSWGWFDERKFLVSHNGGPCNWPICEHIWIANVNAANELADILNAGCKPKFQ
tara:strand:+ start:757 stop:1023 length:267 start_codon:yes stop_codon:yes gene_type:complete